MNLLNKFRQQFNILLKKSVNKPSNSLHQLTIKNFGSTNRQFRSTKSGESNRSQQGFFQGKRETWGFMKSFSMRHTRRRYKLNVKRKMLYSRILQTRFLPYVTSRAVRTIKKYDNYVLNFKFKSLKQSQFAMYLRGLLMKKLKDPNWIVPKRLPMTTIGKEKKKRLPHELKGMSSIYVPVEVRKTTDMTEMMSYLDEEPRWETEKTNRLMKELENVIDAKRRNEILEELDLEAEERKLKQEMLTLMPIRHKYIRDALVKIKDKQIAMKHLLETLDNSENFSKEILGEDYKHFSVDYPEVQLILQKNEFEEKKSSLKQQNMLYKADSTFEMGHAYEGKRNQLIFNPYPKTAGSTMRLKQHKDVIIAEDKLIYKDLNRIGRVIHNKKGDSQRKRQRFLKRHKDLGEIRKFKV